MMAGYELFGAGPGVPCEKPKVQLRCGEAIMQCPPRRRTAQQISDAGAVRFKQQDAARRVSGKTAGAGGTVGWICGAGHIHFNNCSLTSAATRAGSIRAKHSARPVRSQGALRPSTQVQGMLITLCLSPTGRKAV